MGLANTPATNPTPGGPAMPRTVKQPNAGTEDPAVIRARMARTRESLQRKLSLLEGRVRGVLSPVREGAKILMAKKKSKPAKSKSAGGKSKSRSAASKKSPKRKRAGQKATVTRKVNTVARKARRTLGDVLTGAAAGAAAGALAAAAEAIS